MIEAILLVFGAVAGGLGRRVAGGAFTEWTGSKGGGDQVVRMFFALMIGAAAYAAMFFLYPEAPWWHAVALVPATWVGTTTGNGGVFFKGGIGMGREPGGSVWKDSLALTAHGVLSAIIPCAGMWWLGYAWWTTAIAYLTIALFYEIGWILMGDRTHTSGLVGFRSGSEVAEWLWGAAIGVGTIMSVAWHS